MDSTVGVAVKGAVFRGNRLLLLEKTALESRFDPVPAVRLDLPGGRLAFGELPRHALEREIFEEVGLRANVGSPVFVWTYVRGAFQLVGITYYCEHVKGEVTLGPEHCSFRWSTEEEVGDEWPDKEELAAIFEHRRLLLTAREQDRL